MRWSTSFIPTLREDPADAEAASHRLMVRSGLVRQLTAGVYVYLPLGQRVIDRITAIIREEMNAIGGQELTMPVLHPAELWQQSGRWYDIKEEMFRLKDRHGREMCLGMTHEEVVAWLASKEIRSYRELPQVWYQIQTKERDEARPRSGVLRTREFWMKDAYTLDADEAGLAAAYDRQRGAYERIFARLGVKYVIVSATSGAMGGSASEEFLAESDAGEDTYVRCLESGYAANVEAVKTAPAFVGIVRSIPPLCELKRYQPSPRIEPWYVAGPFTVSAFTRPASIPRIAIPPFTAPASTTPRMSVSSIPAFTVSACTRPRAPLAVTFPWTD